MTSETKTPEQAALEYANSRYWDAQNVEPEILEMDIKCGKEDFLAGRAYFIENELRALLKAARELAPFDPTEASLDNEWRYTISELLERARNGK